MPKIISIPENELLELLTRANARARMEVVSATINDKQLQEMLGNPDPKTLNRWIKDHGINYTTVGYRKIFRRSQIEKILNNLIDKPLKVAS
jgi:hypothetical protein